MPELINNTIPGLITLFRRRLCALVKIKRQPNPVLKIFFRFHSFFTDKYKPLHHFTIVDHWPATIFFQGIFVHIRTDTAHHFIFAWRKCTFFLLGHKTKAAKHFLFFNLFAVGKHFPDAVG